MKTTSKRGQLTIFIIVGIILVVAILMIYSFVISPSAEINPKENPREYILGCMKDALKDSQEKILPQGGYISPSKYIFYDKTKVPYFCYTSAEKQICTILEPMYKNHLQDELEVDSIGKINSCFETLKKSFSTAYEYAESAKEYSIDIQPEKLIAKIDKTITLSKDGDTQELNQFIYEEASPLFDFIIISNDILTKETLCDCEHETCSGDVVALSRRNSDYELELFITGTNEKVYSIRDILTNKQLQFSVRNCIRLP